MVACSVLDVSHVMDPIAIGLELPLAAGSALWYHAESVHLGEKWTRSPPGREESIYFPEATLKRSGGSYASSDEGR